MILTSASQLGVPFKTAAAPAPSQPSISSTNLLLWWDPGNPSGYVAGSPNKLVNLAPTGTAYDGSQTTYVAGAGSAAELNASGRYITFTKGSSGGALIFKTPSITTGFIPANQAFTWITWVYANSALPSTALSVLSLTNFSGPPFLVRFALGSATKTYQSNSTGASNFTGNFSANTWYMLAMTVASAGGSSSTNVTRNAYINGAFDSTSSNNVTNSSVSRAISVGHLTGNNSNVFRQGMSAVYTAALSAEDIQTIYNTYSPYYV